MGNYITYHNNNTSSERGKLILSDGKVFEFEQPLTVAELMLEHPQQVVVEFCPDLTEKKPTPLPADKKLDMKKVYLMLPMKRGKPASLSSVEARHVLLSANSVLRSRALLSSSKFLPLFARMCRADVEGERNFLIRKKESCYGEEVRTAMKRHDDRDDDDLELLTEILEGRPEYLSRQLSGKGWKPSLDTIKEKMVEKKIPHWLF